MVVECPYLNVKKLPIRYAVVSASLCFAGSSCLEMTKSAARSYLV